MIEPVYLDFHWAPPEKAGAWVDLNRRSLSVVEGRGFLV